MSGYSIVAVCDCQHLNFLSVVADRRIRATDNNYICVISKFLLATTPSKKRTTSEEITSPVTRSGGLRTQKDRNNIKVHSEWIINYLHPNITYTLS